MDENERKLGKAGSDYAKYTGLGFQMVVIIGLMTWGGYAIDEHAKHNTKWVTAVMALAGVFISLYIVIKSVSKQD